MARNRSRRPSISPADRQTSSTTYLMKRTDRLGSQIYSPSAMLRMRPPGSGQGMRGIHLTAAPWGLDVLSWHCIQAATTDTRLGPVRHTPGARPTACGLIALPEPLHHL
jgi:hypothetical protein